MRHLKRHIAPAFVAAALLAAALPGVAGASTLEQGGNLLATGTYLRLTSVGDVTMFSSKFGEDKCGSAGTNAKIVTNGPQEPHGLFGIEGSGASVMSGCRIPSGGEWNVEKWKIYSIKSTESGRGTVSMELRTNIPGPSCTWNFKNVPFTYTPGQSVITMNRVQTEVIGTNCGTSTWSLAFSVSTLNGSAVTLK